MGLVALATVVRVASFWIPALESYTFPMVLPMMVHSFYIILTGHSPPGFRFIVTKILPALCFYVYDAAMTPFMFIQRRSAQNDPYRLAVLEEERRSQYLKRDLYTFDFTLKNVVRFLGHTLFVALYGYLIYF